MRRKQQVGVVSHQTVHGQDSQIFVFACLADQERIDSLLRGKTCAAFIAALNYVPGNSSDGEACSSWHNRILCICVYSLQPNQ
jgi:hypothetical protein